MAEPGTEVSNGLAASTEHKGSAMPTSTPYHRYIRTDDTTVTEVRVWQDGIVACTDYHVGRDAYFTPAQARELIEALTEALWVYELIHPPFGAPASAQIPPALTG